MSHLVRLHQVDVASQRAEIGDDGANIEVDISLLGEVDWRTGSLFSFIGEVDCTVSLLLKRRMLAGWFQEDHQGSCLPKDGWCRHWAIYQSEQHWI